MERPHPSGLRLSARGWSGLAAVTIVFVWSYWPVWQSLVAAWSQAEEYSHGFLIPPLALFIAYRKREALAAAPVAPSPWGLPLVLAALSSYVVSHLAGIATLASLSMVLLFVGAVLFIRGAAWLRALAFPLFLLLFMIPVPAQIYSAATIPLQLLVTRSSVALARLLDIPILREGNLIHLPGHTLQVVQACSGLRSMISLVTLGTVLGYFTLSSNLLRSLLLLCGIPAAILVNIVRVVIMILAYHYLGLDLAEGAVHTVFGTLIFLLALALLFAAKGLFAKWDAPPSG